MRVGGSPGTSGVSWDMMFLVSNHPSDGPSQGEVCVLVVAIAKIKLFN